MSKVRTVERRRKILVDREFQLKFISRLAGALFFYLLLFLLIAVVAPVTFTLLGESPEWAVMETIFRLEVLLRVILAPLLCTFLCLFAHGIIETFRIAGPAYRFRQVFSSLESLCIPRGVKIRRRDYLQETAQAFDKALISLHDEVATVCKEHRRAQGAVEAAAASGSEPLLLTALDAMQRVEQSLARFSLVTFAPECRPVAVEDDPGVSDATVAVEPLAEVETVTD